MIAKNRPKEELFLDKQIKDLFNKRLKIRYKLNSCFHHSYEMFSSLCAGSF